MSELVLGCGTERSKRITVAGSTEFSDQAVYLDMNRDTNPDVIFNLDELHLGVELPFGDGDFTEIHAYEVLEHIGKQGDFIGFFREFTEYHRVLADNGVMCITVPRRDSVWVWGDPGHRRLLCPETFLFLDQGKYAREVGVTAMSDYRQWWKGNMVITFSEASRESEFIVLQKVAA